MARTDDFKAISDDLVQMSRLAVGGQVEDARMQIRRMIKRYQGYLPALAERLSQVASEITRSSPLRRQSESSVSPAPVDLDSRLELVRTEAVTSLPAKPVYADGVLSQLRRLVQEHRFAEQLAAQSLSPSRSALFTGPPGVGKTLAAKYLAVELNRPLLTLDLSAVMSSFLGRSGTNIRYVLDYAKSIPSILLLDEFDAIAKRRDDTGEVGELKRLVTVLLQEIDAWPAGGLLVAATNHPDLLDPAVWRRFDVIIEFPMPSECEIREAAVNVLSCGPETDKIWADVLAIVLRGSSLSDVHRELASARRSAVVHGTGIEAELISLVRSRTEVMDKRKRAEVALRLVTSGAVSQREAHELTGTSRDTIRRAASRGTRTS